MTLGFSNRPTMEVGAAICIFSQLPLYLDICRMKFHKCNKRDSYCKKYAGSILAFITQPWHSMLFWDECYSQYKV